MSLNCEIYNRQRNLLLIFGLVSIFVFTQCANIVPPSGGPVDSIPPKILKMTPADSSLNMKPKKIEIVFDKYMELGDWSTIMTMSPLLEYQPQVTANMKKIVISLPDTLLLEKTTYTISLGNTLKDNREGTPYPNFVYTFSTGDYIDSLSLQGQVLSADRLIADSSFVAVLYPADGFEDSMVLNKKPLYVTPVQTSGVFEFRHLPERDFRMFVLHDKDNDKKYNPIIDGIAFDNKIYTPLSKIDSLPLFSLFYKDLDSAESVLNKELSASLSTHPRGGKPDMRAVQIPKEGYLVQVDTTQIEKGTQELTQPLTIAFNKNLIKNFNNDRIFLSFDKNGVDIQAITEINVQDSIVTLSTDWQEDTEYTLRLIKSWAIDTAGLEIAPNKYNFKTKKNDDYTQLTLKVKSEYASGDYGVIIFNENDSITSKIINDTLIVFERLIPKRSAYQIYMFKDLNKDGIWTSGDFIQGIQPEPMWIHEQNVSMRAGWEHEETFKPKNLTLKPITHNIPNLSTHPDDDHHGHEHKLEEK